MTIYIYGIFFNADECNRRYCYIGSTKNYQRRFAGHISLLEHNRHTNFMQNVYNKHGINKLVVFKRTTDEEHRIELEQEYYDFFARHGYVLVNATTPKKSSMHNYSFSALSEYREHVSASLIAAYASDELRCMASKRNFIAWQNDDRRKHASERTKQLWNNVDYRSNITSKVQIAKSKHDAVAKFTKQMQVYWQNNHEEMATKIRNARRTSEQRKLTSDTVRKRYENPEERRKCSIRNKLSRQRISEFARIYGTSTVFSYDERIGKFERWHNFVILPNDSVIVFVWDTRQIQFECKVEDLPAGYHKVSDSHLPLIDNRIC